jgi:hypothetical protein
LSDAKIIKTLESSIHFNKELIPTLFKERQSFIPIARNPFTAALISSYAKENDNQLPAQQADLYINYINQRLKSCHDHIAKKNLSVEQILQCTADMAALMFSTPHFGLEAPVNELAKLLDQHPVEDIIGILKYARLGRVGGGDDQLFSFVHRRFNEYFVAQMLIEDTTKVSRESIPTDSRWRDALVMFCEVADEAEASKIASFCWSEVKKIKDDELTMSDPQYLRSMHCLRFLKDAFRSRHSCLVSFQADLTKFVNYQVEHSKSLLEIKFAVEVVGLLDERELDGVIAKALEIRNAWVQEEAFKACRHLQQISDKLSKNIEEYMYSIDVFSLYSKRDEILFSLKLSQGFSKIHEFVKLKLFCIYCNLIGFLIFFILAPVFSIVTSLLVLLLYFLDLVCVNHERNALRNLRTYHFSLSLCILVLILIGISVPNKFSIIVPLHDISRSSILFASLLILPWFELLNVKLKRFVPVFILYFRTLIKILPITMLYMTFCFYYLKMEMNIINLYAYLSPVFVLGFSLAIHRRFIDFKLINKDNLYSSIQREFIFERLDKLKTAWGQNKFLTSIDSQKGYFIGRWPKDTPPKCKSEKAATILAKLDEKSLGLD